MRRSGRGSLSVLIGLVGLLVDTKFIVTDTSILIDAIRVKTFQVNVPRSIVTSAIITFKAKLPRVDAAVISMGGNCNTLTVKGVVKSGLLGALFILNITLKLAPKKVIIDSSFCRVRFPTLTVLLTILKCFSCGGGQRMVDEGRKQVLVFFCLICLV